MNQHLHASAAVSRWRGCPEMEFEPTTGIENYHLPVELPFQLPTSVYGGMLAVWQLRPYLQRKFPLQDMRPGDWLGFLSWCCYFGRREYALLRECDDWTKELLRPVNLPALKNDAWGDSFNVAQYLSSVARSRFRDSTVLQNTRHRAEIARWYWREGRQCLYLEHLPLWQKKALENRFSSSKVFFRSLCSSRMRLKKRRLLRWRRHLDDVFSSWGRSGPRDNEAVEGGADAEVSRPSLPVRRVEKGGRDVFRAVRRRIGQPYCNVKDLEKVLRLVGQGRQRLTLDARFPDGVNLFGYAKGELGIGEDVRSLAHALNASGVPFCIINISPGKNVSCRDTSVSRWISEGPKYNINLFCVTGVEQTRILCEYGAGWLKGRYNIGLWPWELPEWPKVWHHAWNQVQEIWGISQYTAAAYREAPVPVKVMPLPVSEGEVAPLHRKDFGLPEDTYLFVFSFDFNSSMARKNPEGVLAAFWRAFPDFSDDSVGLVIKVSHVDRKDRLWRRFFRKTLNDDRIYIIDEVLRRSEVMALYRSCNCFVSLHRAEGFGRAIAEAQLLGLEVIATGFSGNLDFCSPSSTHLVRYHMRRVGDGEYFHGDGQYWAEPDVSHAAELMRLCAGRKGGVQHPEEIFGLTYCGERYASRIHGLIECFSME